MAINGAAFASTPISTAGLAVLEIVATRPDPTFLIDPPTKPGRLIGYYNQLTGRVELFVTNAGGTFWIEVG